MTFLDPFWLPFCALPVVLALYAIYARRRRKSNRNAFVSSARLEKRLINQTSPYPWWISTILITLACILIFISLAQPTDGRTNIELPSKGRQIYLAVDCSRSMLVKDVTPDRLTVAKTVALELIEAFPQEKIGLISFAGRAWLEAPLTTDHTALRDAVLGMDTNTIPMGGSSSGPLLEVVAENQPEESRSDALLLILSDGEFHKEPSPGMIKEAASKGIRIFTLGFGTMQGDFVPDDRMRDGMFRDRYGNTIISTLQPDPLEKIARLGGGRYFKGDDYSFLSRIGAAVNSMSGEETGARSLVIHKHIYYIFLIPALFFLVLAALTPHLWNMMKSATALILTALLLSPELEASPLLASTEQPTREDLADKDYFNMPDAPEEIPSEEMAKYEKSAEEFKEKAEEAEGANVPRYKFAQGEAEYRAEKYENAISSFSDALLSEDEDLQTEAHYNLGNSLYKFGEELTAAIPQLKKPEDKIKLMAAIISQWNDSLDHYTGSLNITKDHKEARENYDYVKKKLEELKETQKQMMQDSQQQGDGEGEGEGKGKGKGEGSGEGESGEEGWTEEELKEQIEKAKEDGEEPNDGGEEEEEGEEGASEEETDRQEELERRPGESERDYAQRRLEEGSDSETGTLKSRRNIYSNPEKDW